jgi:cysteine synthase B
VFAKLESVNPGGLHQGLKPLGHPGDIVPEIVDESLISKRIAVTLDASIAMCKRLSKQGLFVGPSSGAYAHAALELADSGRFRTIVTVLSDTGERYGSTGMWEREQTRKGAQPEFPR